MKQVEIKINGEKKLAEIGQLISAVMAINSPCGGHGKCGKCKVVAHGKLSALSEDEKRLLTKEELFLGVRLACKTRVLGYCEIEKQEQAVARVVLGGVEAVGRGNPIFKRLGVAVDVGTTTVAAKLFDFDGKLLSEGGMLNAQASFGADVISRIEANLRGEDLATPIRETIDRLISEISLKAGVNSQEIDGAVITGNTVMLSLLSGVSVEPLSKAPFKAKSLFGSMQTAGSLGISSVSPNASVYLPRCISAFVGADITTAMTAVEFEKESEAVLVDVGTNGEIALIRNGKAYACSTAAGPAFEGVGISCGMNGSQGAIDKVSIVNGGLFASVIGGGRAKGVCGSGIIDAVACLLDLEALDDSGYLEDEAELAEGVTITQKDIRSVQLAKSAICAGIKTLVKESGAGSPRLYIAGGFGSFINLSSAGRIGLIPTELAKTAIVVGNAALSGAVKLLLDSNEIVKSEQLAEKVQAVELAANKYFIEEYTNGMFFD